MLNLPLWVGQSNHRDWFIDNRKFIARRVNLRLVLGSIGIIMTNKERKRRRRPVEKESFLKLYSIYLPDRKTSIRLHPLIWEAVEDIARRQGKTVRDVLVEIDRQRGSMPLSTAVRVYIVEFYRRIIDRGPDPNRRPGAPTSKGGSTT